jgi:hypothetical protein
MAEEDSARGHPERSEGSASESTERFLGGNRPFEPESRVALSEVVN